MAWRKVRLDDGELVVRPWRDADAPAVGTTPRDPVIGRYFGTAIAARPAGDDPDAPAFAIESAGRAVGRIWCAPHRRPFEVGYFLREDAWGNGYATRALRLVSDWLLTRGETPVVLFTHPENAASQRVAERAGFRRDGVDEAYAQFKDGTTRAVRFVRD